jgi:penicillin-binding protein 1A
VIERVGPAKVARLARAMGVRESPLEEVPSLALGTSPVTLKEMVAAYGTIADDGVYRAPQMVTRIDDANGNVLAEFAPAQTERALAPDVDRTLVDAMRDVVNYGTGSSIRSRFGIRADVAGKTGTTQDGADGWFILMHPELVAGAWVGFDDGRVTLRSDYWAQGAHTALPIVGEFFQRALRARIVDARVRFDTVAEPSAFEQFRSRLSERLQGWREALFGGAAPQRAATGAVRTPPAPRPPSASATEEASGATNVNESAGAAVQDTIETQAQPAAAAAAAASVPAPASTSQAASAPPFPVVPDAGGAASEPAQTAPSAPADMERESGPQQQ